MVNTNLILKDVLELIRPEKFELDDIKSELKNFIEKFEKTRKKLKINAEIFVGGSFAKGTVIKKDNYDLDVFIRFTGYKDAEISDITENIIKTFIGKFTRVHGSRDYFRVKIGKNAYLELIPVIKVKNPKDSSNITDLSYSHVKYVKKKISRKILDEIMLAKAFCYASKCYGAESYIRGFSGYSLELIVYHYKGFMKFARNIAKSKNGKIIIDIEKFYKNKNEILMNLNSSKLQSPIILIDPTFRQRNVTAALSDETFEKFREVCIKFLKNPGKKFFEQEKTDFKKLEEDARKKKYDYIILDASTNKQEGDIAGSKLLKFYNHINEETERFFEIKEKEFEYNGKKSARYFISAKAKKEVVISGPSETQKENAKKFREFHKNIYIKKGRLFAKENINFSLEKFIKDWKEKNPERISEMSIISLDIANLK